MKVTRRNHLAAMGSALLAASSLSAVVKAQDGRDDDDAEVLYGHGLVWNRALAGVAGEVKLAFDLRVNLKTGVGFGPPMIPCIPTGMSTSPSTPRSERDYAEERASSC